MAIAHARLQSGRPARIIGQVPPVAIASFRFYGPLNDFLPTGRRQATLVCSFDTSASVKDLVEALGVPHPEIDLLVVDGEPVTFAYRVKDGNRVAAYPVPALLDVPADVRLGPPPQDEPRLVADAHLGRLAAYLRLAGFDVAYRNDVDDHELVEISADEDRVLLTRDIGVLKHGRVRRGYFVRNTAPGRQLVEVIHRFDLAGRTHPFTRCLRCNARLAPAPKCDVEHVLPPGVQRAFEEFSRCPDCGRVFWKGSHYHRMDALIREAITRAKAAASDSPR